MGAQGREAEFRVSMFPSGAERFEGENQGDDRGRDPELAGFDHSEACRDYRHPRGDGSADAGNRPADEGNGSATAGAETAVRWAGRQVRELHRGPGAALDDED